MDTEYGNRLLDLPKSSVVWIIDSDVNRPVWEQCAINATIFGGDNEGPEYDVLIDLDTIICHHMNRSTMDVIGLSLSPQLRQAFEERGADRFVEAESGFFAERLIP